MLELPTVVALHAGHWDGGDVLGALVLIVVILVILRLVRLI
jgi:hypothetical protein